MGKELAYYNAVADLLEETLAEDPVDAADLPIDEDEAKKLIISSMCEHWEDIKESAETEDDLAVTAITILSKVAYENFVLNLRLHRKSLN